MTATMMPTIPNTPAVGPMRTFECPLGRHRPWKAFPNGTYAATCFMCERSAAPTPEPGPGPAEFKTYLRTAQSTTQEKDETMTTKTAPKTAAPKRPRSAAAKKAAEHVETHAASTAKLAAITEAEDAVTKIMEDAIDPYRRAVAMKKASGKRGPGRKVTQDELVAYLRDAVKAEAHAGYRFGQHVEVAYWIEGMAINRARMAAAWAEVTGEAPATRAAATTAPAVPATRMGAAKVADIAARKAAHRQMKAAAKTPA